MITIDHSDDLPARHFPQWPKRSVPGHLLVPGTHKWLPLTEQGGDRTLTQLSQAVGGLFIVRQSNTCAVDGSNTTCQNAPGRAQRSGDEEDVLEALQPLRGRLKV